MQTKLDELLSAMSHAEKHGLKFAVEVKVIGCDKTETIINPSENLKSKIEYYSRVYDEECRLKANTQIEIINYAHGLTFSEIENNLIKVKA